MPPAVWLVAALIAGVWFGSWALQIAAWILVVALRLLGALATGVFSVLATVFLAVWDRPALERIWRNRRVEADNAALLARERWG